MAYLDYIVVIILLGLSGLFSGLTLGLMSLDVYELKRKIKLGNNYAKQIYPLRKHGNLLLCTLLLGNVAVNSVLAIFLGSITTGVVAGITATGLIVIFGEILPQSLFSKYALKLGAKTTWLVYIFYYLLYPISKPLSMLLDSFIGGELPTAYSKREVGLLLEEQQALKRSDIDEDDVEILKRGLVFSDKIVKDIMTPKSNTFFLKHNTVLTEVKLETIHNQGHSRIPVYNETRDKVIGILYAKDLISVSPDDRKKVRQLMRKTVQFIKEDAKLDDVLEFFKKKRVHLFVVRNKFKSVIGIVTLEDVLEEIVGEIVDEHDRRVDMRKMN